MKIETQRLILREYCNEDFVALCEILLDRENMKHYHEAFDKDMVKRWITWNLENYQTFGFGLWAIVLKTNGKMIGDCGITMQRINGRIRPEIGYHIHHDYHNQGYATEAAIACKNYIFENTSFNNIYSYMNDTNIGSWRVAMKNGMQLVEEYIDPVEGKIRVYAINRNNWQEQEMDDNHKNKELAEMSKEELWRLFPIVLVEHQKYWSNWYKEETLMLSRVLPINVRISHIGSTTISTIWAKPIIDILVESNIDDFIDIKNSLGDLGYLVMHEEANRIDFNKGYTIKGFAKKVFHLHLRVDGDNDELYYRDYLQEHPQVAKEYEKLKRSLWLKYEHDRDGYTNAKTEFIKKYTMEAKMLYKDKYQHKKYKTAIFDLDGTLLDTLGDLTNSINYVLEKFNYPSRTKAEVRSFMGNGVKKLVELALPNGLENPNFRIAYELFLDYYRVHCNDVTAPYPEIMELLKQLTKHDIKIAIVSNKVDAGVKALNDSYFKEYISVAIGENENAGIRKKPYPDTVWQALEELNVKPEDSVYIGDTEVDAATARNAHLDCVLVKWGFRDPDVLEKQNAMAIISKPRELLKYFD